MLSSSHSRVFILQFNSPQSLRQAPPPVTRRGRVAELDGIRALAILLVLGDHLIDGQAIARPVFASLPSPIRFVLGHGWMGVDLFFVLSGFLITGILLDTRGTPHYFKNFYARRVLRIFPLYFVTIGILALFYSNAAAYFWACVFFLGNFSIAGAVVPHGAAVFWSLAIEEQFYLVWPALVRFCSRRGITLTALALVLISPALRVWATHNGVPYDHIYTYTWFRCDSLAIGALMAVWVRSQWNTRRNSLRLSYGLLGLAVAITVCGIPFGIMNRSSVFRFTQGQLVFAAMLLAAVTLADTKATAWLRIAPMVAIGEVSYCLYLTHLGIQDFCFDVVGPLALSKVAGHATIYVVALSAIWLATSFLVAALSRRYFENPILELKKKFEYRPKAAAAS